MTPSTNEATGRSGRPTREELVDATITLLRTVGPQAVQARRIAAEVGASTIVVYRRFGGMPQLMAAVVDAGFDRLAAVFAGRPAQDDPVAGFCDLAVAYREVARADPHLFDLMFGLSNPGGYRADPWTPTPTPMPTPAPDDTGHEVGRRRSRSFDRAYEPLVAYVDRAVEEGFLRDGDPEAIAAQLWSFSHGFVVLELAGHFGSFAYPLREVFGPLAVNLVVGLGDNLEHATAVMRNALIAATG